MFDSLPVRMNADSTSKVLFTKDVVAITSRPEEDERRDPLGTDHGKRRLTTGMGRSQAEIGEPSQQAESTLAERSVPSLAERTWKGSLKRSISSLSIPSQNLAVSEASCRSFKSSIKPNAAVRDFLDSVDLIWDNCFQLFALAAEFPS